MLLSDEEIREYIDNLSPDETFENWINGTPWKIVAKAQLKKVLEELEEWFIWGQVKVLDLEKGEVEWTMHCISDEDWQSLLKEVE